MSELEAALENAHIGWDAERALADDLATMLTAARTGNGGWWTAERERVLARWREARQR